MIFNNEKTVKKELVTSSISYYNFSSEKYRLKNSNIVNNNLDNDYKKCDINKNLIYKNIKNRN